MSSSSLRRDLAGQKFGMWTAISYAGNSLWRCVCDCGREGLAQTSGLRRGKTKSCGCGAGRWQPVRASSTLEYRCWVSMRQRCNNPRHKNFPQYGARGIDVCDRWNTFANFLADMGAKPAGKSLDRIDSNKGYFPENCRWATPTQQIRNRRGLATETHCRNGHEFTEATTIYRPKRCCLICERARSQRASAKQEVRA